MVIGRMDVAWGFVPWRLFKLFLEISTIRISVLIF